MADSFIQNLASNAMFRRQGSNINSIASELMKAKPQDAKEVAKDFEAVFVAQMLQNMFNEVPVDDVFGGGSAEETWRTLMVDQYGRIIAKAGGIGVADQVQKELLRLQGV